MKEPDVHMCRHSCLRMLQRRFQLALKRNPYYMALCGSFIQRARRSRVEFKPTVDVSQPHPAARMSACPSSKPYWQECDIPKNWLAVFSCEICRPNACFLGWADAVTRTLRNYTTSASMERGGALMHVQAGLSSSPLSAHNVPFLFQSPVFSLTYQGFPAA